MQTAKLGAHELSGFIQSHSIPGEILHLSVPTPTVEAAAQAVGAQEDQIIKSILFMVDGKPVLAIACGLSTIGRRPIADLFGVGKKRVKLATPEMVLEISGYEVGAMPPFGHRQPLTTLIDQRVLDLSEAYAGGGAENALMCLNPQDILRVTGAKVLDLLE
jgi:prolyl-tRNA editing enzyme YbaK/EbsC (Cys-tRNA(Pro) deacylase)